MKKLLFSSLTVLMTVLTLAACGTENEAPAVTPEDGAEVVVEDVTIDFWHIMTGVHLDALYELIDRFHAEHPEITINPQFQGNANDIHNAITASAVARTFPHLAQVQTDMVTHYVSNNFLTPLTPFFDGEEEEIFETFREAAIWNDEFYAIPFGKSTRILFYNRELLDAAGLEVPTTWEELMVAAEILTQDGVVGMGFENNTEPEFMALVKQFGGVYIDEETATARFAEEAGLEAANFIFDMIDNGTARFGGEDGHLSGVFGRGAVAMYIGSSAGLPHVANAVRGDDGEYSFEWGTAPTPSLDGNSAVRFAGNDLVMFNGATEAEQAAIWAFMSFTLEEEETARWAANSGYIPVTEAGRYSDFFINHLEENPTAAAASDQFDAGFVSARVNGANTVVDLVREAFEAVRGNLATVEEAFTNAQERANETLEREN